MRHELGAQLALVAVPVSATHSMIMWERSQNGDVSRFHHDALATPAGPRHVDALAFPTAAAPALVDWVLARFALTAATVAAEDQRAAAPDQ